MSREVDQQNAVETYVKSALIQAIENDDEDEVNRLIDAGADVHETDDQRRTALLCAVQNDVNINIIRALVENGEAFVNAKDCYGRSSLFYALTKSTDTASYLFKKAGLFNDSDVCSILSFFIDWSLSTKSHDSHPTIDEVLSLLEAKDLKPKKLAKSIVNILLCKIPLLSPSLPESHRSKSLHPMFHLFGKRESLLYILNTITKCNSFENYSKKESIEEIVRMIECKRTISAILDLLKKHSSDLNFADSDGNTALHYATCLAWMGVPQGTVKEICGKLQSFGVPLDKENHLGQTPLLFCLSGSIGHLEEKDKLPAMKTLVEVCKFLVLRGSTLEKTTKDRESVFHLVIKLFQDSFEIPCETIRQDVIDEMVKLLQFFAHRLMVRKVIVRIGAGDLLNSPLHRWASLVFMESDYTSFTPKYTFEVLLKVILTHLIECGAVPSDRNKDEETPLHLCNTWSAVKLLIDKGANPNDVDSSERPPLLVAASKETFLKNPPHFYPDFQKDGHSFFTTAVENKLDPWTVVLIDKQEISVLGILIKSENYILSKDLVEVACNLKKEESQNIFVSLLNAICKDESVNTHWKMELAEKLLSCAKKRIIHIVSESLFTVCCETISKLPIQQLAREESSLLCKMVKMLRSFGGQLSENSDQKLKNKCQEIDNILKTTPVQVLVPWTSRSKTHKTVLDKVARRQKSYEIGDIIFSHKTPAGSFGSGIDLFVGINKMNSKEVAIKRITAQYTQEVTNLYAHLDCEQVIRYFLHIKDDNDANFKYIVFELMEGNLDEYLNDGDAYDPSKGANLCEGVVKGLSYLHKHGIRHFQDHLKPTSIFYKTHPQLCLKITDFDQSKPADGTCTTYVWSSPEVLRKPKNPANPHSDMFSCGLLQHYILSKGKHPFSPAGCTCKSKIVSKTKDNIRVNKSIMDNSLLPEAVHLTRMMLENNSNSRPTAEEALCHPLFWSSKKKVNFLIAVGNQSEFGRSTGLTPVETDLEKNVSTIVVHGKWNDPSYKDMPPIYTEMTSPRRRSYDTHSVVQLVRFIRNAYAHVSDDTRSTAIKKMLLKDFVFLEYFPDLVMEAYKVVTDHGWDQTRLGVKYAMKE